MTSPSAIEISDDRLRATIAPGQPAVRKGVKCVLDRDDFRDVIGVEILGIRGQLGRDASVRPGVAGPNVRWSYDEEMDAFYLHLRPGTASHQEPVEGLASLNADGELVALEIPI